MRKSAFLFTGLLVVLSLALAACQPAATTTPETTQAAKPTQAPQPTAAPAEKVQVRWFVGLGAGSDEPTFAAQEKVVADFNASQDKIELILEIVDNDVAYDTLATQIAAGNAPDIVGPVGIRGRDSFKGAWLDLQPLIDKHDYDLSDFDPNLVKFYLVKEEGQLGIPFGIFPSFLLVNKDLFDEAGLPYPPQTYGDPYVDEDGVEHEWDMAALRALAMKLTVDANGNDATSPDFDPEQTVQFGFGEQWTDARGYGTFFGPGSLVAPDGSAKVPQPWEESWQWFYDAMWTDHFHPNGPYGGSDLLGAGNWFQSGNIALVHIHLWYVACCMGELKAAWDFGVVPSYDGTTTAKMHADTFGILKASKHPDEAFEVLTYLLGPEVAPELLKIYGGMPARLSLQDTYFESAFPDLEVNWDVVVQGMAYADNPNHESWMPSFQETTDRYNEFWNLITNTPDLDLDAEIATLEQDLTGIFKAAQ